MAFLSNGWGRCGDVAACAVPFLGEDELGRGVRADIDAERAAAGEPAALRRVDRSRCNALADLDAVVCNGGRVGNRVDQQLRVRMQRGLEHAFGRSLLDDL